MIALVLLFIYAIIIGSIMMIDANNEIRSSYDYEILKAIIEAFADNNESTTK